MAGTTVVPSEPEASPHSTHSSTVFQNPRFEKTIARLMCRMGFLPLYKTESEGSDEADKKTDYTISHVER